MTPEKGFKLLTRCITQPTPCKISVEGSALGGQCINELQHQRAPADAPDQNRTSKVSIQTNSATGQQDQIAPKGMRLIGVFSTSTDCCLRRSLLFSVVNSRISEGKRKSFDANSIIAAHRVKYISVLVSRHHHQEVTIVSGELTMLISKQCCCLRPVGSVPRRGVSTNQGRREEKDKG